MNKQELSIMGVQVTTFISAARSLISQIKQSIKGDEKFKIIESQINNFDLMYDEKIPTIKDYNNTEEYVESVMHLLKYLDTVSEETSNFDSLDDNLIKINGQLKRLSQQIHTMIGSIKDDADSLGKSELKKFVRGGSTQDNMENKTKSLLNELSAAEDRHNKRTALSSAKISELEDSLHSLESLAQKKIDEVDLLYVEAQKELNKKIESVDVLLGTVSASVIAGNYDTTAKAEKKMADSLRNLSLGCMTVIALVVGYSLYETTTYSFKWENSLFRMVFTILLSIPAAYLAGESAKHRRQHYAHLQTSLDLKAITPYLASLPIETQHKLKSDMANRLFAPKSQISDSSESYPINTTELLVKIFELIESNKKRS